MNADRSETARFVERDGSVWAHEGHLVIDQLTFARRNLEGAGRTHPLNSWSDPVA